MIRLDCNHIYWFDCDVESFVKRITIPEIKQHPWFLKNLPKELIEIEKTNYAKSDCNQPAQSVEEIMRIIQEAKTPGEGGTVAEQAFAGTSDDLDADLDAEVDVSGDVMPIV